MKQIKFDVKKTGFPVVVGDVELFFDSSIESLRKFLLIDETVEEKLKELDARIADLPDLETEIDAEDYDKAEKILKLQTQISWDATFGEGTFDKLYAAHPDLFALAEVFDQVGIAVGERVEELAADRVKGVELIKKQALAKKKKKAGKVDATK